MSARDKLQGGCFVGNSPGEILCVKIYSDADYSSFFGAFGEDSAEFFVFINALFT